MATKEREGSNKWERSRLFVWKTMEIKPGRRNALHHHGNKTYIYTYLYTYVCLCVCVCVCVHSCGRSHQAPISRAHTCVATGKHWKSRSKYFRHKMRHRSATLSGTRCTVNLTGKFSGCERATGIWACEGGFISVPRHRENINRQHWPAY